MVTGRDGHKAEQVAKEISESDGRAIALKVDVANRKDVEGMVQNVMKAFNRVDSY